MKQIKSRQNPEIKSTYALRKSEERKKQKAFIAEGERACITLIQSQAQPRALYVTEKNLGRISPYVDEKDIRLVTSPVMEKVSQATTPSGILGVFEMPLAPSIDKLNAGIVLTNISDPGNMGTLIRTCAAMDAQSIVIVGGTDPWSFKVVQATAGYIVNTHLFQWSWNELTANTKKKGLLLAALVPSGGKKSDVLKKEETLLVVGGEAHGIPEGWLADCNEFITLTMPGKIESLNVAVAGSIALYLLFQPE